MGAAQQTSVSNTVWRARHSGWAARQRAPRGGAAPPAHTLESGGAGDSGGSRRTPLRCFGLRFFLFVPSGPVNRVTTKPLFRPAAIPVFSKPPADGILGRAGRRWCDEELAKEVHKADSGGLAN